MTQALDCLETIQSDPMNFPTMLDLKTLAEHVACYAQTHEYGAKSIEPVLRQRHTRTRSASRVSGLMPRSKDLRNSRRRCFNHCFIGCRTQSRLAQSMRTRAGKRIYPGSPHEWIEPLRMSGKLWCRDEANPLFYNANRLVFRAQGCREKIV